MAVTPQSDAALEAIALLLMTALNNKWQGSVAQISAYDRVPSDPAAYPHLFVYSHDAEGEDIEDRKTIVRYMLLQSTANQSMPGQFRTMSKFLVQVLRGLRDPAFNWQVQPGQRFKYNARFLEVSNALLPFFTISFNLLDLEPLE